MAAIKKIGILTSGGDAPGMNGAIRAVVRTCQHKGIKTIGIRKGYNGLINSDFIEMKSDTVSETIHRGGTILLTARAPEMMTEEGQKKAANIYKALKLDGLVVIGGDGSYRGAMALSKLGVNTIGIPATIDLDINSTEYSIGFDTAVNTAMGAINRIRDTSTSHERCSVVEVMGRDAGYLAIWCGLTGGAEDIIIPEIHGKSDFETIRDEIIETVLENRSKGKTHNLIILTEGMKGSEKIASEIQEITGIDARYSVLGHLQRGGSPTAVDRMHGSMMGYKAARLLEEGKENRVVAFKNGAYVDYDIGEALEMKKEMDLEMYNIAKILSI